MSRNSREVALPTPRQHFDPPLRIGVISDTHIYEHTARRIPQSVFDVFRRANVGLMLHAGDASCRAVLADLGVIAPLIAVAGNTDTDELQELLPLRTRFTVGRHRFGMIHGHTDRSARSAARATWRDDVDCLVFGHSHAPLIEQDGDRILFNPGSATDRRWNEHFGIGIISVTDSTFHPELVLFTQAEHLANISFEEATP